MEFHCFKEGEFGILRIRRNDTGDYACEATSFDSSTDDSVLERDSVVVHLNVQCVIPLSDTSINSSFCADKPEINVLKTRRFLTLLSGNAAELECFFDANPVPSMIRWTRNGRVILAHEEHINDGEYFEMMNEVEYYRKTFAQPRSYSIGHTGGRCWHLYV